MHQFYIPPQFPQTLEDDKGGIAPQQTGWDSLLYKDTELRPSDLLVDWQEAVTYQGTELRSTAGRRLSHMTLGWSTSGQRPLSVLPMIPLGTQVSSSSLLLQMPSTTQELERQAAEMAVLCQDCVLQGTSWLAGSIPSLHTGRAGNDTSAPSFSTNLLRAQRQCSPLSAGTCFRLTLRVKTNTGLHGRLTSKPSSQVFSEPSPAMLQRGRRSCTWAQSEASAAHAGLIPPHSSDMRGRRSRGLTTVTRNWLVAVAPRLIRQRQC